MIANPFCASFTTTDSKSRINFLKLLRTPYEDYVLGDDALMYMKYQGLSQSLLKRLETAVRKGPAIISGDVAWERRLTTWGIRTGQPRRIVTEGALFGTLMHYGMYLDRPLVSDDAGQFKVLGLLHGLCWLHAERSVRKLVPLSPREQEAIDRVREDIWKYYQRLRGYQQSPTPRRKAGLERDFDRLFTRRTGFVDLNAALKRIHEKRTDLLLVLDRPEIPLHNSLSENDIREWAKKRKISAGTRSELGRRCRDTFVSLKKTCSEAGRLLLAVSSGPHTRTEQHPHLARPHSASGPGDISLRRGRIHTQPATPCTIAHPRFAFPASIGALVVTTCRTSHA